MVRDGRSRHARPRRHRRRARGRRRARCCCAARTTRPGGCSRRDELVALAAIVDRHGARVVADEVHAPLVYAGHEHVPYATVSDAAAAHTITVTSASKAFNLAGLKCAQVVASNHADAARWRELRVFEVAGSDARSGSRRRSRRTATAGAWLRRARRLPRRQPPIPRRARWPPTCRRSRSAAGVDVPGLARLFGARARRSGPLLPRPRRVAVSDGPPFGTGCEQHVRLNFATSRAILEQIVAAMAGAVARAPLKEGGSGDLRAGVRFGGGHADRCSQARPWSAGARSRARRRPRCRCRSNTMPRSMPLSMQS